MSWGANASREQINSLTDILYVQTIFLRFNRRLDHHGEQDAHDDLQSKRRYLEVEHGEKIDSDGDRHPRLVSVTASVCGHGVPSALLGAATNAQL
jgi:hypothetical protein